MSDPLNTTVFGDGDMSSKIASSGLADNMNINKPAINITTQLHTPLPRPSNVSTLSTSSSSNSSMGAINRARSTEDPLAMSSSVSYDAISEQQPDTPSPEKKVSPVDMFTSQFISKISTPPINPTLISRNISGLHILASCNAWKHVIELSFELMQGNTQSAYQDGQEDLSIVFVLRMIGLFRLKLLDELQQDCSAVLAQEESKLLTLVTGTEVIIEAEKGGLGTFLRYPRPPIDQYRVDNIVSLQLLFAEVKVVTGHGDEALNWLYMLKEWLSTPEDTVIDFTLTSTWSRTIVWKWKVTWSIINVLIRQRLWRQSIKEMLCLVQEITQLNEKESGSDKCKFHQKFSATEVLVFCRISRSLIQIGALKSAGHYLDKATIVFKNHSLDGVPDAAVLETHIHITKGLLFFSNDQFDEASELFNIVIDSSIDIRASNFGSMGNFSIFGEDRESEINFQGGSTVRAPKLPILAHRCAGVVEMEDSLLPIAVNNFAVCSLHLRKMKAAVLKMEDLIQDDPSRHMVDPIVFNLCTMYDLSYGPSVSTAKKQALQIIAEKYNIDDLNWRSFRLN